MENKEKLKRLSDGTRKAFEELMVRCEKAGIEHELTDKGIVMDHELVIHIQQGRGKREIRLFEEEDAQELLDSDFERYVFVEGYEAMCCYDEGCVEASIGLIGPGRTKASVLSRLTGISHDEVARSMKAGEDVRLELDKGDGRGLRVLIGSPSKTLAAMAGYLGGGESLSVKLEGFPITKNSEAGYELGRVTNSLFFELRTKRDVNLFVRRHYDVGTHGWRILWRAGRRARLNVEFPKFEYDREPIELYWHAMSAYRMPLLQYLGYYQIIEYYFMRCSMLGAKREIRNLLKDPGFSVDDDKDVAKIAACVSEKLGPHVSENELLRDTVRECVSEADVISEVSMDAVKKYFKKDYRIVSQCRVYEEDNAKDIRDQLADRIYDIRCRIVHTKEGDRRGRIMPFTKEEALLRVYDLPMLETVADKALIANSKELRFG